MALFSKQNKEVFTNPLNFDHPILGQVLGICSALAVTSQLKPAIVMGLAVTVITAFANVIISIIRNTIPNRIRIVVQLVVVAALVTIVSQVLKAYVFVTGSVAHAVCAIVSIAARVRMRWNDSFMCLSVARTLLSPSASDRWFSHSTKLMRAWLCSRLIECFILLILFLF